MPSHRRGFAMSSEDELGRHITVVGNRNVVADRIINSNIHIGDRVFLNHVSDRATARDLDPLIAELVATGPGSAPFGGRAAELSRLNQWLESRVPYLLLHADAGFGKSSLLFHWV